MGTISIFKERKESLINVWEMERVKTYSNIGERFLILTPQITRK